MQTRSRILCTCTEATDTDGADTAANANTTNVLDETALDDNTYFKSKMGKYAKAALKAVRDVKFWIAMRCARRVRASLDILSWTIMKVYPGGEYNMNAHACVLEPFGQLS